MMTRKTKDQLIEELNLMRQRMAQLESELRAEKERTAKCSCQALEESRHDSDRKKIERTHVEFIADFDVIEANAINISQGGICFAIDEDLPFEMRFNLNGELHQHRGHLVWVKRMPQDGYHFGLMFTRPDFRMTI